MKRTIAIGLLGLVPACGPPMRPARTSPDQLPSERELVASTRVADAECTSAMNLLFPGIAQMCQGRTAEGVTMTTLGAAELGTGITVGITREDGFEGFTHPAAAVPLLAYQNLYIYSWSDAMFQEQLAARELYTPEDTPAELAIAPFNANVLGQTDVWLGTVVLLGLGIGFSELVDQQLGTDHLGEDANIFGKRLSPAVGYPLAGSIGAGLFSHVAVGEEAMFRGVLLSQMARETNPTLGWVGASLVFGVAHAPNAIALPTADDQLQYLAFGVPFLTGLGSYLGIVYQRHHYSLAAPVAIHFWYDFLLSATFFAVDPQHSPLAASVAIPF